MLGLPSRSGRLSRGAKSAILIGVLLLTVALVALIDPQPDLGHVRIAVLSGSPSGNYHAIVDKLARHVAQQKGALANVPSAGSVENVGRLIADRKACAVHFALVQDGIDYPDGHHLQLIGRLPHFESLLLLGRDADRIRLPSELKGLRVGIGPIGSGTEQVMRRVLTAVPELDLVVSTQPIDRQLDMLEKGELDLGAMVIDDKAALVADAVNKRGLQILGLPGAASFARQLPFARVGQIEAGQIDYLRLLPPVTKPVLQIDTLVVGNGCASNGVTQGFLSALAEALPTFIAHNRGQPNVTGLPMPAVARNFYSDEGPDLLGRYAPWAVDIMPLPTWIQVGVAFSVLFSLMAVAHRFRLWRIDAARVRIEREISELFGRRVSVADVADMPVGDQHRTREAGAEIDEMMARLDALAASCRAYSVSVLVPMGEEMSYRYQEGLISDLLNALRLYRERLAR